MYYETFSQMQKMLGNLDTWLEKATAHAAKKPFDVNLLMTARLAPDQFPLARQVQSSCDNAKLAAARLTGKEAPSHPDTEKTVDELRARIKAVRAWLSALTPKDFEGAAERTISQPRWEGKWMSGADYFVEYAVPNFYFHLTHAYAILRHNGVEVGKRDYLGSLSMRDA